MAVTRDSFVDLEKHRLQLEQNVAKLRSSLQHWQAWEIEYEGMKEDILGLGSDHTQAELVRRLKTIQNAVSQQPDPEIEGSQLPASSSSECLHKDSKQRPSTLKKRVSFADGTKEEVTHAPTIVAPQDRSREEIAQIIKQIQQEHYVGIREAIEAVPQSDLKSEKVTVAFGQKLSLLEKVRDKKLKSAKVYQQWKKGFLEQFDKENQALSEVQDVDTLQEPPGAANIAVDPQERVTVPATSKSMGNGKKVVNGNIAPAKMAENASNSQRETSTFNAINNLLDNTEIPKVKKPFDPIIPANESPEDAALRRQMIQYNMDEVGAVVAELDLDEDNDSADEYSEDGSDENSSVEEDEDQFGRTKRRVLDDGYRAQMEALQKKLTNIGPDPTTVALPEPELSTHEPKPSNRKLPTIINEDTKPARKKSVSFANSLDVQE
ncbi:hypothetical protein P7C71_g4739, partial [Lecanoromycetidae sp. Uapishka_2]